jgi:hypothetical protein
MKRRTTQSILRNIRTVEHLDRVCAEYTIEWAGSHKGRRKILALIAEKRKRLEKAAKA